MSILVNARFYDRLTYDDPTNYDINTTYSLGDGDHKATISGNKTTLITGDGDSIIEYTGNDGVISTGNGDNTINYLGNNATIKTKNGKNNIYHIGDNANISTGNGNQTITSIGNNNNITTEDGDDEVVFLGNNCNVDLGNGNNRLIFYGDNCEITMGSGNDYVTTYDQVMTDPKYDHLAAPFISMLPTEKITKTSLLNKDTLSSWQNRTFFKETTYTISENTYEIKEILSKYIKGVNNTTINMGTGENTANITANLWTTKINSPKIKIGDSEETIEEIKATKNNITYNKAWQIDEELSSKIQTSISEEKKKKNVFWFIG